MEQSGTTKEQSAAACGNLEQSGGGALATVHRRGALAGWIGECRRLLSKIHMSTTANVGNGYTCDILFFIYNFCFNFNYFQQLFKTLKL